MASITYRALWRWHFHAGLLCIPFVLILAITGAIYLFKPQIDALADRDVDSLALTSHRASGNQTMRCEYIYMRRTPPAASCSYTQTPLRCSRSSRTPRG